MSSQTAPNPSILVVDDEPLVRQLLTDMLSETYSCTMAESAEEGLAALRAEHFSVVISDINLGGMSGVEMLPHIQADSPDTVVMMISGNPTMESPIGALREGAFDYLQKPFDFDYVTAAVKRAVEHHDLLIAKRRHEEELEKLVEERTTQLNFLKYHDPLTSLPNRALVEDRLGQMLASRRSGKHNAVMLVAIDRLGSIRETLGSDAANEIVLAAAGRIIDFVAPNVTIGRVESDVFVLLVPEISPEQCVDLTGQLTQVLDRSFEYSGNELFVHSKIGVSLAPDDGDAPQVLIHNAAAALAHARESSGSSIEFYTAEVNELASDRIELENDLRRAVDREELEVYYQPKLSIATGAIVGMEALARWQHPKRGFVPPDAFVKLAEDVGIIDRLGEHVLRTACERAQTWREAGFALELAVNLSGLQLQEKDCSNRLIKILQTVRFDAACLNFEVTETAIMHDLLLSIEELSKLRNCGVKVSIDDFGTGYSSLHVFKRLPVDVLKIDRSFVCDLAEKPHDTAFVKMIIDLAHLMNVKIVAEGVETEEQLAILRDLGCDEWQGYLFSKPLPADEFEDLLQRTG